MPGHRSGCSIHDTFEMRRILGSPRAALLIVAVLCACGETGGTPGSVDSVELTATDALVTTASERIGGVYDLTVSPDGDVYVADYGFKHVLVIDPDGAVRRTIGREGSGPGEFEMPYVVSADADSVRVLDAASNRAQVFDGAGVVVRTYQVGAAGLGAGRDFASDGSLAATMNGFENAMILLLDPSGAVIRRFGEPIVPPINFYDFTAMKSEIRNGRVPDAFRNRAMLVWAPDSAIYLAFLAEPVVRRYAVNGQLLWSRTLDEPVLRATRDAFMRKNAEEQNPSAVYPLQYVTDAAVVGTELWLLLNTADERDGLILVFAASDGGLLRRITFPGLPNTGFFAVDQSRHRLYMAPRGEASILIFELPGF